MLSAEQLINLAGIHGTPLYVYDADQISNQYALLKKAFAKTNTKFFYACKALTNVNVLRHINKIGASADCSSINEVKLALIAGFDPGNILYTSNGIHFSEIEAVKDLGVHINIDSLHNLEKFGKKFAGSYPIGIRLRPNIMAGGNLKISTGHDRSKFGIPIEHLPQVLEYMHQYKLHIQNLHIHTGSDIKDVAVFVKGIEVLLEIIPQFPQLTAIDLGGGFKVPYKNDECGTDIQALADAVHAAFTHHNATSGKDLQVWFEPGKFLVSAAGYLLSQVNVIKETPATTFAGLNTGFNHLIRPMFYDAWHDIKNLSNPNGLVKPYSIVGNICETDTFAWDRPMPEMREGDIIAFYNAGAYGFEMSSNFNSRFKPAEVLVEDGNARLIRRRDNFEDLLRNQIIA